MKNYYLGLDIGTNSCGWAVTDENYNILRSKGKKLWGVRLFDEANKADDRRIKRANRRRLVRQKLRIEWLNEIFKAEIDKCDASFLNRLRYSSLWEEDKILMDNSLTSKDSLFLRGSGYSDDEFYVEFPTIYHLREKLLNEPAKDIRLLYLAIHSLIKNRGHFLYEGDFGNNDNAILLINDLIDFISESDSVFDEIVNILHLDVLDEKCLIDILLERKGIKYSKTEFCKKLNTNSKLEKSIVSSFVDGKVNLKELFNLEEIEKSKLEFSSDNFDVDFDEVKTFLTDDQAIFIEKLKNIYSVFQLKLLLGNNDYLCQSMIEIFNKHKSQLKEFKLFIKKFYPKKYYEIFRLSSEKISNYTAYVGGSIYSGKKQVIYKSKNINEDFYKYIKSILSGKPEVETSDDFNDEREYFLYLIDNGQFLPKQRTKNNAVIPNKLLRNELLKILNTNKDKFSFLNKVDESGLTNIDKIISIFEFKIPYFVGPIGLSNEGQNFTWSVRDKNIDFKPWNLSKMIDFDKSEDEFIQRMTNKCTYLQDQEVLPKSSILFSKYKVLNELNNLKIDGKNISVELKQKLFNELFKKKQKVTIKNLKDFLVCNNYYDSESINQIAIAGVDGGFANNFGVYYKLTTMPNIDKNFVDKNIDVFEKIIKYHTIITDKNRLEKRIQKEFGEILSTEQIKQLKGLNYQGWGTLSKKFLGEFVFKNKKTNMDTTIIDELWNTNQNLMQIIYNTDYTLLEELQDYSKKQIDSLSYDMVEETYCSPSVKRGIWQTINVVNELVSTLGQKPEKIFIEVTRHDDEKGDKGRKLSRKTNLLSLYSSSDFKSITKKQSIDLENLLKELNEREDLDLRSDKLFLYFMQLGKCAYSGESINIEDIYNDNLYDVDHIIPQSQIKDDSINNRVLVKKQLNEIKDNNYPIYSILPDVVMKQKYFWKMLVDLKLMTEEKYNRLVRTEPVDDEFYAGFVARQLVETNQSVKAVADILKMYVDNPTQIVYSKASFVSDFRQKYDIVKSRIVNDFHHAKDAYLNIVVGNVINNRFTNDPRHFYIKNFKNSTNTKNIKKIFDYIIYSQYGDDIVWKPDYLEKVKENCSKNDCLVSEYTYCNNDGAFYDETIYKSLKNDEKSSASFTLKGDVNNPLHDIKKYGGYNSLKNAYFMVVESEKKGKKIKTIEAVPTIYVYQLRNSKNFDEEILKKVAEQNGLVNPKILIPKLKIKSLLKIGKGYYYLGGKTGDRFVLHNANQWNISSELTSYIKHSLEKFDELKKQNKEYLLIEENDKIIVSKATKTNNKEYSLTRQDNLKIYDEIIRQLSKDIYTESALGTTLKEKLIGFRDRFNILPIKEQNVALNGIMKGLSTGASSSDLSIFGDGKTVGKILIGKDITDKNIILICQSPTGIYTKEIKL